MAALRILVRSDGREQEFVHHEGPLEVGRGRERDVPRFVVTDPTVSRDHLRLMLRPDGWLLIENLSSSTEIFHDRGPGLACGAQQVVPLPVVLGLGDTDVVVDLVEEPAAPLIEPMIGEGQTLRERVAPPAPEPEPVPQPIPPEPEVAPAGPASASPFRVALRLLFSPTVAEALADVAAPLAARETEATLMLAEFRGLEAVAARHGAERAFELLGELGDLVGAAVEESDGALLEATGGAFLASWNAPSEAPGHPLRACLAARRIVAAVAPLTAGPDAPGEALRLALALRTGTFAFGRTGGSRRLRYGPLAGLDLLRAQAAAARALGLPILVDAALVQRLPPEFAVRRLGALGLPAGSEDLYELGPGDASPAWQDHRQAFERGLALVERGDFPAAARELAALIAAGGGSDLPTVRLLARALEAAADPPVLPGPGGQSA